jgi:ribosome biogenesis protein UTP30
VDKIRKKWTQYEAQRKLFAEHDIFLADDRIIIQLPKLLGKTFYKSTTKRPIPVSIQAQAPRTDGKRIAKAKDSYREKRGAGEAKDIAKEIEKAIGSALVHLSSSTNTAIRVGYSGMKPEELAENIEAVSEVLIEKFVVKKWRGVRALHVKGAETASLPIWLADELWVDEKDVLGEEEVKKIAEANVGKKRKTRAIEGALVEEDGKKEKKRKLVESNDNNLDKEIAARKEKLKKQKAEAALDSGDEVPKPSKKSKKGKEIAV